jgi:hypothetical protein
MDDWENAEAILQASSRGVNGFRAGEFIAKE